MMKTKNILLLLLFIGCGFADVDLFKVKSVKLYTESYPWLDELHLEIDGFALEIASLDCRHIELGNHENPNIFVEKGKTIHSRRRIPIDDNLVACIREFKKYKESWGETWSDDEPFLCSHKNRHYRRENIYVMFKRVLALAKNIDRPQRFYTHSMRHTFAVRVYQNTNYNVELVRQLLGHSSIEVTMVYLAAFNCEKRTAIQGLYD